MDGINESQSRSRPSGLSGSHRQRSFCCTVRSIMKGAGTLSRRTSAAHLPPRPPSPDSEGGRGGSRLRSSHTALALGSSSSLYQTGLRSSARPPPSMLHPPCVPTSGHWLDTTRGPPRLLTPRPRTAIRTRPYSSSLARTWLALRRVSSASRNIPTSSAWIISLATNAPAQQPTHSDTMTTPGTVSSAIGNSSAAAAGQASSLMALGTWLNGQASR